MENNDINFKTIFKDFLNTFNLEKGIIPTVKDLIISPNLVLSHYIERKKIIEINKEKYYLPARFFVTIVAFISICSIFAGENLILPESHNIRPNINWNGDNEIAGKIADKYIMLCLLIFGIIPQTFASKLVFIGEKEFSLAMHFVMNIYLGMITLLFLPFMFLIINSTFEYQLLNFAAIVTYYGYAFKKIFNLSILITFQKVVLFSFFSTLLVTIFYIAIIFIVSFVKTSLVGW